MKGIWIAIVCFLVVFWTIRIADYIVADYQYERNFSAYWNLADKASTLEQKSEYIDQFRNALQSSGMEGSYNAMWFTTPDNSFDRNFQALSSLESRLTEIRGMDQKSFEYQQAISQITAQEQGEAGAMLGIFEGCWYVRHHFWLWDWVGATVSVVFGIGLAIAVSVLLRPKRGERRRSSDENRRDPIRTAKRQTA